MRTPNTQCLLCAKPLYRCPSYKEKYRYAACMACRSQAQKVAGITERQHAGLSLGREKGTNHRDGYTHKPESRLKASISHRKWCASNIDKVAARAEKSRGELHYKWKGGISKLNVSIRQMTENRKWMEAVKVRDGGRCVRCKSTERIESHHKVDLAVLIASFDIKNRYDARQCKALWDLSNGETLCEKCHYVEHGRRIAA